MCDGVVKPDGLAPLPVVLVCQAHTSVYKRAFSVSSHGFLVEYWLRVAQRGYHCHYETYSPI